jgi:biopolymer transport protein ExbB
MRHYPAGTLATTKNPLQSGHYARNSMIRALQVFMLTTLLLLVVPSGFAQAPAASAPMPAPVAVVPASPALIQAPALSNVPAIKPAGGGFLDNPYGLQALWQQGDFISKTTLLVLLVMSLGTWYVLVAKLIEQLKFKGYAQAARGAFWKAGTVRQGADSLHMDSPFRFIAESALDATQKHEGLIGQVDLNTWVTQSIQDAVSHVQSRSQDGLAVLATVGSTATFVGLFGTVWGIYNALVKIGASGQASIDKVAGPVGEALIMTAIGLAVAVPAVLAYNWLVRRNKLAMDRVKVFGSGLHTVLLAANVQRDARREAQKEALAHGH